MASRGGRGRGGRGRGSRLRPPSPISRTLYSLSNPNGVVESSATLDDEGLFLALPKGLSARPKQPSTREVDMLAALRRLEKGVKSNRSEDTTREERTCAYRYSNRTRKAEKGDSASNKKDWFMNEGFLFGNHNAEGNDKMAEKEPLSKLSKFEEGAGQAGGAEPADQKDHLRNEDERDLPSPPRPELEEDDDYGREENFDDDDDDYHHESGNDEAVL